MSIPLLLYQILFKYVPIYGWAIAFKNYKPGRLSMWEQPWVGFSNFVKLFTGVMGERFTRAIVNTLGQSVLTLVIGTVGYSTTARSMKAYCAKLSRFTARKRK